MEQYLKTLKRNQTVYKYACDEAEVDNDYGTYVVPGLKSTRTLKVKGDGEAEVCTSMTPQGLAFTEDYILVIRKQQKLFSKDKTEVIGYRKAQKCAQK